MTAPLLREKSRFCNLSTEEMQYVNTIIRMVSTPLHPPQGLTQLLDHLYLGSYDEAVDKTLLKQHDITHIVNTVEEVFQYNQQHITNAQYYNSEFQYLGFTSDDKDNYPIMKHSERTLDFIDDAKRCEGKCLIHCVSGINRSGVLATAYVMVHCGIGPISAAQMVFNARGTLLSNNGFIEQLVKLAKDRGLLTNDEVKLDGSLCGKDAIKNYNAMLIQEMRIK